MTDTGLRGKWALILGASSGFGGTVARRLSREGMNIFGVHLDRKATQPNAEKIQDEIRENGAEAVFFNVNAAGQDERAGVIQKMTEHLGGGAGQLGRGGAAPAPVRLFDGHRPGGIFLFAAPE